MPQEGSYGGYIVVRKDGSVLWQVAAREFPENRDTDGTLEYAIRVVTRDRNVFSSRDGKCLINVHIDPIYNRFQPKHLKFLIVSGYETPVTRAGAAVVGRSYFVSDGHFSTGETDEHYHGFVPPYDLTLRYDDYDLDRAKLPLDLEPEKLSLCHQNWVSVRQVLTVIQNTPITMYEDADVSQRVGQALRANIKLDAQTRDVLFAWADLERTMREAGMDADLKGILIALLKETEEQGADHSDVFLSRWRRVKVDQPIEEHGALSPLDQAVAGEPVITALSITDVPGSRAITARGLTEQGTFALMYHGDLAKRE